MNLLIFGLWDIAHSDQYWKINVNLRPNIEYTVLPRLGGKRTRKDYKYKSEFLLEPNFQNYEMLKVMKFTSS